MDKNFKKMMIVLLCLIIQTSVFATGSIAIDGHVLSIDFKSENYIIQGVIVKSDDGQTIIYQSQACQNDFCSYLVGEQLASWDEIWVRTSKGVFKFYKV
jgi:hypothetical protein